MTKKTGISFYTDIYQTTERGRRVNYVFYPDVFWITNFGMDLLILLLVRRAKRSRSLLRRVFLAASFGATASVLLFLKVNSFALYQVLVHVLVNPAVILIGFPVRGAGRFWRDMGMAYLMTVFLGGILSFGMASLGQWEYFFLWALGAFGVCMLTLCWLESGKSRSASCQVLLLTEQRKLTLVGFWDTGNLLEDPFVKQPVHIIQEQLLSKELSEDQLALRYIPFHSLGQEQGLLPVVTLKAMYIREWGEKAGAPPLYIEKPVFGLAKEKLFQREDYQVILNARCISA